MTRAVLPLSLCGGLSSERLWKARGCATLIVTIAIFSSALLFSAHAIASEDAHVDSDAPLVQPISNSGYEERDYIVWPFIYRRETPAWKQFSFIPFYVEKEATDDSEKRIQLFWPVYLYKRSDLDVSVRIFPAFTYWKDVYAYEDGYEYDIDYMILPFFYGGDSTEEGKYFAFFPIAGTFRSFLGRDEIRFFLFPLYLEYLNNELYQRNYLWPILSFSEGGGYSGFRLWPLYGRFEKQDEYRNTFLLWPFITMQTFDLDKEEVGRRLLILPMYAREDSRRRRYRSILWPFFAHEQNYARNFEQYSIPWPFVVVARGDVHRTQLWPLYGYKRTGDSEARFLLWPFWRTREFIWDDDMRRREVMFMPFISSISDITGSREVRRHRFRFWPLWRFNRFEDGSTRFRMLSLFWFDDEPGFEEHYSPLWTVYERETAPGGEIRGRAFWGLLRHKNTPARSETHVPLLYAHTEDSDTNFEETKILGGLLGLRKEGGERKLQILYVINLPCGK